MIPCTNPTLIVAGKFGKKHKNVIRAIKNRGGSEEFTGLNFALSEYTDSTGRTLPMYNITRAGTMKLLMGFKRDPVLSKGIRIIRIPWFKDAMNG